MARTESFRQDLRMLSADGRTAYLDAHSGLPGPRGNLELLQVAVDEGDADWFDQLLAGPDEYTGMVGAVGLGRLLADRPDPALVRRLHALAADPRWRVREGVAMALQRLGDADPDRFWGLAWAATGTVGHTPLVDVSGVMVGYLGYPEVIEWAYGRLPSRSTTRRWLPLRRSWARPPRRTP